MEPDQAYREKTPTRERVCLNGLWRWQPAESQKKADAVPAANWGYLKVPGNWPGSESSEGWSESLTYYPHPSWKGKDLSGVVAAWYQREFTVPEDWAGRRIAVSLEYLNSVAVVFVDGKKAGEAIFRGEKWTSLRPAGRARSTCSILAAAVPLGEETTYFARAGAAFRQGKSGSARGLCGDVYLVGTPAGRGSTT